MRLATVVRTTNSSTEVRILGRRIGLRSTWRVDAQNLRRLPLTLSTIVLRCLGLGTERVDYSVHGSSCALDSAVRDVLGCVCSALRHVPRRADRPSLNADSGNGEGEHD